MDSRILKFAIALVLFTFFALSTNDALGATKNLEKDTRLVVAGSTGMPRLVNFKGGTEVVTNDMGEVIEGVLAEVADFFPPGYPDTVFPSKVRLKEGTRIILNNKGEVVRGTLAVIYLSTQKAYTSIGPGNYASTSIYNDREKAPFLFLDGPIQGRNSYGIPVKLETEISFHDNGTIATCTIFNGPVKDDILLRPVSWLRIINSDRAGFVKFKSGTRAVFNTNLEVIRGTLEEDVKLKAASGEEKILKAGTEVDFSNL